MRIQQYKILVIAVFGILLSVNAQKKSYKEEFKVKSDVVIDVNTRYTDIEIETWNKDEVVIEATMTVEGKDVTQKIRDNYFDKWQFEAMGNTSKVNVKSRTNNHIDIHSFNFDTPDYNFHFPDVSIASLDILDSMDFELPEIPEVPEIPELPELPPLPPMPTEFDFDAYKKDKSYLKRWKKENKDILGENAEVSVHKNSIKIKSKTKNGYYNWGADINVDEIEEKVQEAFKKSQVSLEKSQLSRNKALQEARKVHREAQKQLRKNARELKENAVKVRENTRKLALVARQEAHEKRRKEMQRLLKKRENIKVKRVIKIKAPKNAKFNMNVKYGSMSFPKN